MRRRSLPSVSSNLAYSEPYSSSSCVRIRLASVGLCPPVDIAICRAPRRTIAGAMKSHTSGVSTIFTQTLWSRAALHTAIFTSGWSVAPMTSAQPTTSSAQKSRGRYPIRPWAVRSTRDWERCGLTTTTRASASSNPCTFRVATSPPPTTRQRFPCKFTNTG
jgi:hypothetical protein